MMTGKGGIAGGMMEYRRDVRMSPSFAEAIMEQPFVRDRLDLVNLSTTGALVAGRADIRVKQRVRLILLLDSAKPTVVTGHVVDVRAVRRGQRPTFALHFERITQRARNAIGKSVLTELKRLTVKDRTALVVDSSNSVRRHICDVIRTFGGHALSAGSILESLSWLGRADVHTAYVGNPIGSATGFELATFVASRHQSLRAVLLVDELHPQDLMQPLSKPTRLAILDKPWAPGRLACFLLPCPRAASHERA